MMRLHTALRGVESVTCAQIVLGDHRVFCFPLLYILSLSSSFVESNSPFIDRLIVTPYAIILFNSCLLTKTLIVSIASTQYLLSISKILFKSLLIIVIPASIYDWIYPTTLSSLQSSIAITSSGKIVRKIPPERHTCISKNAFAKTFYTALRSSIIRRWPCTSIRYRGHLRCVQFFQRVHFLHRGGSYAWFCQVHFSCAGQY